MPLLALALAGRKCLVGCSGVAACDSHGANKAAQYRIGPTPHTPTMPLLFGAARRVRHASARETSRTGPQMTAVLTTGASWDYGPRRVPVARAG
jgi:hypothetical protein